MSKNKRVTMAITPSWHQKVQEARRQYAKELNNPGLRDSEVMNIWGEGKLAKFKIPKLRLRKGYKT